MTAYECECGMLHRVRWDEDAGIDGSYVAVCPYEGTLEFGGIFGNAPGRFVSDFPLEDEWNAP